MIAKYRKTLIAVGGAVILILSTQYGPDSAIVQAVISVLTALGVYGVANKGA